MFWMVPGPSLVNGSASFWISERLCGIVDSLCSDEAWDASEKLAVDLAWRKETDGVLDCFAYARS